MQICAPKYIDISVVKIANNLKKGLTDVYVFYPVTSFFLETDFYPTTQTNGFLSNYPNFKAEAAHGPH